MIIISEIGSHTRTHITHRENAEQTTQRKKHFQEKNPPLVIRVPQLPINPHCDHHPATFCHREQFLLAATGCTVARMGWIRTIRPARSAVAAVTHKPRTDWWWLEIPCFSGNADCVPRVL